MPEALVRLFTEEAAEPGEDCAGKGAAKKGAKTDATITATRFKLFFFAIEVSDTLDQPGCACTEFSHSMNI